MAPVSKYAKQKFQKIQLDKMSGDQEKVTIDQSFEISEAELRSSVTSRDLQRSDSCNSSVMTSASNWSSFLRSASFVTLNPWSCYLNFRKEKIITVEPVLFLYMFANFMFTTLTQQYFFNRYALDFINEDVHKYNGSSCINASALGVYTGSNDTIKLVEDRSTLLAVYCSLPYRLLSLIATLILGPISDYYGRRPVMIIVMLGGIIQGICALCIVHFNLNLYFFILAYGIAGICGGLPAIMMASFSYISDVSTVKWRTVRIGIVEAMVFLAGVLASLFGGWWFKQLNCWLQDPLILIIACHVAGIFYIIIFLPPSIIKEQRRIKNRDKARGIQIITRGFKILFCAIGKYRSSVWMIWVILVPTLVVVINMLGSASVNIFFLKALNWGSVKIGAQIAAALSSRFLALLIFLPIFVALKMPDSLISLIGAVFNCAMNLFMGLSHKPYQVFIGKYLIIHGLLNS